jgi:hypothetical protein
VFIIFKHSNVEVVIKDYNEFLVKLLHDGVFDSSLSNEGKCFSNVGCGSVKCDLLGKIRIIHVIKLVVIQKCCQ